MAVGALWLSSVSPLLRLRIAAQAGIVHAAEASLSQLMNLLLAFLLLKCFGIGRASAVGSMSAKLISFVMVTVGLFLCTLEDSPPSAKSTVLPKM